MSIEKDNKFRWNHTVKLSNKKEQTTTTCKGTDDSQNQKSREARHKKDILAVSVYMKHTAGKANCWSW